MNVFAAQTFFRVDNLFIHVMHRQMGPFKPGFY